MPGSDRASQMLMKTINIAEILSPDLSFRAQARGFRQFVEENDATDSVTVDFSGVRFASRAFLDEFYNLFLSPSDADSSPFKVEVVNLPASIAAMLEAVVKSNTQPRVHPAGPGPEASTVKFKSVEEMLDFFGSKSSSND